MALKIARVSESDISLASAGMPPSYHIVGRANEVRENLISSLPLGALAESDYRLNVLPFDRGDFFVAMSDGLPELRNENGQALEYDRVQDHLENNRGNSAQEVLDSLIELGENWRGDEPLQDDVTIVVVRRL